MRNLQIEALFGGALALVVIGVAVFALANTSFSGATTATGENDPVPVTTEASLHPVAIASENPSDLVCECYDKAFSLAGGANVLSAEYRTGFEQCRARAGVDGGDAWTAGWNARIEAKPYEASCKAYKRRKN